MFFEADISGAKFCGQEPLRGLKNRINGVKVISTGTLTATLIRPADVYAAALDLRAAAVVFVHNHPSGDPRRAKRMWKLRAA
jgi:DNA repair protein RadC